MFYCTLNNFHFRVYNNQESQIEKLIICNKILLLSVDILFKKITWYDNNQIFL